MTPFLLAFMLLGPAPASAPRAQTLGAELTKLTDAVDPYPPLRPTTRTFSFLVESDADLKAAYRALNEGRAADARCQYVDAADKSWTHTKSMLVLVEAPIAVEAKEVLAALRKGSKKVEKLACTTFDADSTAFASGVQSARDKLIQSSSEVTWANSWDRSYQIYTNGKRKSGPLGARLAKVLDLKKSPDVARHSFTWTLEGSVDADAAKRVELALRTIDGVESARIDVAKRTLDIEVSLDGLDAHGPPYRLGKEELAKTIIGGQGVLEVAIPKARFDTTPLFDVLEREKIALVPAPVAKK